MCRRMSYEQFRCLFPMLWNTSRYNVPTTLDNRREICPGWLKDLPYENRDEIMRKRQKALVTSSAPFLLVYQSSELTCLHTRLSAAGRKWAGENLCWTSMAGHVSDGLHPPRLTVMEQDAIALAHEAIQLLQKYGTLTFA